MILLHSNIYHGPIITQSIIYKNRYPIAHHSSPIRCHINYYVISDYVVIKYDWIREEVCSCDIWSKVTPVPISILCHIVVVFHLRASYWLLFLSFNDNWFSHSWDTIRPWKFKVKGQGQRHPSQSSVQLTHFLSASHQGILSTPVPFVSWQSGLPFPRFNLTLKVQGHWS